MRISGNTILITGGGSGIGRALAEAFHEAGNEVVIAGRRRDVLDEVIAANAGMRAVTLDIENPDSIRAFTQKIVAEIPALNVVIHNAGIMRPESIDAAPDYLADAEAMITTNLLGPVRLTAALLPHLRAQADSAIVTVSSGLAFVPMAMTPTYCATKAAIHAYSMSLRQQLQGTATEVIEIVPPYVQTHLTGEQQANDPNAMPLEDFITEVMQILAKQPAVTEVVVKRCDPLRYAVESGNFEKMFQTVNAKH